MYISGTQAACLFAWDLPDQESGDDMTTNQKELAAILGVTARHLRDLKKDYGLFADGMEGKRYILERCVPEYIDFKLEKTEGYSARIDKEREQAEHERVKKHISELKLRRLKYELHEASDVELFLSDMLAAFRSRLLALPQKVAPLIVGEDDTNEIIKILEKETVEVLQELKDYDPMAIDRSGSGLFEEEEGEEDEE